MKAWLSRAGHAFVERNVDDDPEAYAELLALGWRTVPVTFVAGRGIRGFDPAALARALEAAAGSPPGR